jgi:hypothetical protein
MNCCCVESVASILNLTIKLLEHLVSVEGFMAEGWCNISTVEYQRS